MDLFASPAPVDPAAVSPTGTPYQRGSATSKAAAASAQTWAGAQAERVYRWVADQGERGGTQKECDAALGIGRPSCCARFRALEQTHRLMKTHAKRDGCYAYVAMEGR